MNPGNEIRLRLELASPVISDRHSVCRETKVSVTKIYTVKDLQIEVVSGSKICLQLSSPGLSQSLNPIHRK